MEGADQIKPVVSIRDYIVERGKRLAARASAVGPRSFFDYWDIAGFATETIKSYPGSGKSYAATELANRLWKGRKLPTLYLMLSHSAIEERLARLKEDGEAEGWEHWRGHDDGCQKQWLIDAGYTPYGGCACDRGPFTANAPTLAPIEYALPSLPDDGSPLLDVASKFFLWIIDEIDLRRLLGQTTVNLNDVRRVGETHPDEAVKALCGALAELMGTLRPGKLLNGNGLYSSLVSLLASRGVTYLQLRDAKLPSAPWLHDGGEGLPMNFPPVLVPVLLDETYRWNKGWQFNPRIHLVRAARGPEFRVWWRKDLKYDLESGPLPPPAFILDATADVGLLGKVFKVSEKVDLETPAWPDNVHVHQWVDDLVSRSTLGLRYEQSAFSAKSKQDRERWYGRIAHALADFPHDSPVGIITHKLIETEATGAITAMGFTDVCSLHYGDERGSNTLEKVRVLVLLGLPIPNIDGFKEEAQAFLYDEQQLDFTWETRELAFNMREKTTVPVQVDGYWTEPVASYYGQKCQSGLYQALHRIRPYIPKDYERHIFIFTNMPIQGVTVDHLLRDAESERIADRCKRAVAILREQLAGNDECTVPELAEMLATDGEDARSMTTWIRRNAEGLAEATGARYEGGKGGRPGRFATGT